MIHVHDFIKVISVHDFKSKNKFLIEKKKTAVLQSIKIVTYSDQPCFLDYGPGGDMQHMS